MKLPFSRLYKHLLLFFLILTCGCSDHTSISPPVVFSDNIMTINYRILIGEPLNTSQKQKVQAIIQDTFAEIDNIYNKWNPHSEISQLNRLAQGEEKLLSPQLFSFFERIDVLIKLTGGRFDPTIEPIQQLWKQYLEKGETPSKSEIDNLKPAIGWDKIKFANGIFSKEDSRTQIDLGGVAKGYCVDLLVDNLNSADFKHVYVEWGGEIRTTGRHPAGRPWRIWISQLDNSDPNQAIDQVDLIDQAIATSGDYFQHWTIHLTNGKTLTYCHIFNPLTLHPLIIQPGSVASASLAARDCLTADALAKVLMMFDSAEEAQKWIQTLQETFPDTAYWIVTR